MLRERPDLPPAVAWVWNLYWEIERWPETGRPLRSDMRAVLRDEGITEPEEKEFCKRLWHAMWAEESKVLEERRKADEEERERKRKAQGSAAPGR